MGTPKKPKPAKVTKKQQPPEADAKDVKDTIMRLSKIADLIGLRTYIIKRTPKGKSRESDLWAHTRAYMRMYANPANTEPLIEVLRDVGCQSDVETVRFILQHDEIVP
jgi:hypothetical protein